LCQGGKKAFHQILGLGVEGVESAHGDGWIVPINDPTSFRLLKRILSKL
jgi:hypothetical protein